MNNNYFDAISEKEVKWLEEKWGCFSASVINCLTIGGTRPMTEAELKARKAGDKTKTIPTLFGKAAMTYIEKVANQNVTIFNMEGGFESRSMRKGKANEPQSFYVLEQRLGLKGTGILKYCGGENPIFKKYDSTSGASPDYLAEDKGKVIFGGELKNPDSVTHFRYLRTMRTQAELKIVEPDYFGQCQFGMMSFKCPEWYFSSYCEHMKEFADRLLIIRVAEDKVYQNNLKVRLKQANKLKDELINELVERRG